MGKSDIRETLARNIKQERLSNNLTRAQLAERLGISSPSSIGNWEAGLAAPDCDKICMMADLFGVSTDYLFGREKKEAANKPGAEEPIDDERHILERFSFCDEIGQDTIENCVEFQYQRCTGSRLKDRPKKSKNTTGVERLYLDEDRDPEYAEIAARLPALRTLKKGSGKSYMDITQHLWELGYGGEICLAFVMDIFGRGLMKRVPCERLYRQIENYLKGNYRVESY